MSVNLNSSQSQRDLVSRKAAQSISLHLNHECINLASFALKLNEYIYGSPSNDLPTLADLRFLLISSLEATKYKTVATQTLALDQVGYCYTCSRKRSFKSYSAKPPELFCQTNESYTITSITSGLPENDQGPIALL